MPGQEPHVLDAESGGGGNLFVLADGWHLVAVVVVEPALFPVGAQEDRDSEPGVDPSGDGSGRSEVSIVRMCGHHQNPCDVFVRSWHDRLADGPLRHGTSLVGSPLHCPLIIVQAWRRLTVMVASQVADGSVAARVSAARASPWSR